MSLTALMGFDVLEVRSPAEVDEVALLVERDVALGRVDELDLVGLALLLEVAASLVPVDLAALERPALGDLAPDLLLEALERLLGHGLGKLEVVVEAVLDRRPDRHLRPGIEPPRGLGEEVRGRVAEDVEGVGILPVPGRQDLDLLTIVERKPEILTSPFERTRTACSASFGPIARAASRPVAPSGSSSSERSGRMTFMNEENTQVPDEQDPEETEEGSPIPDPEDEDDGGRRGRSGRRLTRDITRRFVDPALEPRVSEW